MKLHTDEIIIKDLMYLYADKGIVTIPVNEKRSAIYEWNKLKSLSEDFTIYDRIDDMFKHKIKKVTGLAVVMGDENLGLSCIDIDSNDNEIVTRLLNAFPSRINKVGRKGCSFFFKNENKDNLPMYNFPVASGGAIEVFYSNKYTVIPPSLHSREEFQDHHYYWLDEGCTLLKIDSIDDLPLISLEEITSIPVLIGSSSVMTANKNLPISVQYDEKGNADGRYKAISTIIGSYVKHNGSNISIGELTEKLLKYDNEMFHTNSFFDHKFNKKHNEIKPNVSKALNCSSFITSMLISIEKREKLGFIETASLPVIFDPSQLSFRKFVEISLPSEDRHIFNPESIPLPIRKFCVDLAESTGVSLQSVFFPFLGALAGVLQSKIVIRPIKNSLYIQRPNLGMILLGHSGSKKTDIIKMVMYRNEQLQDSLYNVNSKDLLDKQYGIQKRLEALDKSRTKAYSDGDNNEAEIINNNIHSLQSELEGLNIKPTKWLYNSGTVQKIIKDHSDNTVNGLFFTADEFSTYLALMQKKGNEEYRSYMMACLNGDGKFSSSTLSRGTDKIDPCFGSVLSTLQPDIFKAKISDLYDPRKTENDGFWQRFTFIDMGRPTLDRKGDFDVRKYAKEYSLFDHAFNMEPREVNVLPDSVEKYEECRRIIELRADSYFGKPVGSFLSKHQGKISKYALLADFVLQDGRCIGISDDGLDYAMKWLEFEANDILRQFKIGDESQDIKELLRIIEMINMGILPDNETASKWQQNARGTFRNMDSFLKHLKTLESHGYIMMTELKANSKLITINPLMRNMI